VQLKHGHTQNFACRGILPPGPQAIRSHGSADPAGITRSMTEATAGGRLSVIEIPISGL